MLFQIVILIIIEEFEDIVSIDPIILIHFEPYALSCVIDHNTWDFIVSQAKYAEHPIKTLVIIWYLDLKDLSIENITCFIKIFQKLLGI